MKLIDILPKFPQYEDIPYSGDFMCQNCGKSGFYNYDFSTDKMVQPLIVGWCETNIGYMAVFECPLCGEKFRFHTTIGWKKDLDEFDHYLYYFAEKCCNWKELKTKLN